MTLFLFGCENIAQGVISYGDNSNHLKCIDIILYVYEIKK